MPPRAMPHTPEPPYGRVTNAARFTMLHRVALELLDRLHREFDVERVEPYQDDDDLSPYGRVLLVRPSVALRPRDRGCAPLIVAFSSFPGLLVRVGEWYRAAFPSCGCDACDESADGEADRFERLVRAVTTGHFREYLEPRGNGSLFHVCEWESAGQHRREKQLLEAAEASRLELGSISRWKPWIGRRGL